MAAICSRLAPVLLLVAGLAPVASAKTPARLALNTDPCGCYQHYDLCLQGCVGGQACAKACQDEYNDCNNNCTMHFGQEMRVQPGAAQVASAPR